MLKRLNELPVTATTRRAASRENRLCDLTALLRAKAQKAYQGKNVPRGFDLGVSRLARASKRDDIVSTQINSN
jgi:hypothetical protein